MASSAYDRYSSLRNNENVQRALATIRGAEGTARRADPYRVGFGFRDIADLSDHPREYHRYGRTRTSAAGAYQALERTWNDVDRRIGLPNFGPEAQDVFAIAKIDDRGALDNVLAGDFDGFAKAVRKEWASFPNAGYGQPTVRRDTLRAYWDGARVAPAQSFLADERLANAWGPMDPNMTRGLLTPDNVPVPTPAPRDRAPPALNGNTLVANAANVPVPTARPAYERAKLDGQPVRYGTAGPQFASLPNSVMERMAAPALRQDARVTSALTRDPRQTSLLGGVANGAANAIGGLLGAATGLGTANAAVQPNPMTTPTAAPMSPDQRVASAFDTTRGPPQPLTSPPSINDLRTPAATVGTARQARLGQTPSIPTPTFASRPAALPSPRNVGPGPAVASAAPVVADPWGNARNATVRPVSPNVDNAAQFAAAPTRSATMKDVARGALLGGTVGGLPGMVAGGLLGGTIGPQLGSMFGGNRNAARGDGINTGLLTGGAIPASVRNNPERFGQGGFTGLGLPSVPKTPAQTRKDRTGGRGDSGPAMSKSASDAIGKAGAGRGGLW